MEDIEKLLQRSTSADIETDYMDEDICIIRELERMPEIYFSKLYANVFCFCRTGRMEMIINGTHYVIRQGDVVVCPSGVFVDLPMVSPDFKFAILALTDRVLQEVLNSNIDIWNRAVYLNQEHVVKPTTESEREESAMAAWHFIELLNHFINNQNVPFRKDLLRSMVHMILLGYCAKQKKHETEEGQPAENRSTQSNIIFNRFLRLLRDEPVKHRPVKYYAEKLCVSPKHLTFACNNASGRTAISFINQATVDEITALLKGSSLSVKEIAQRLGFGNLSIFGKYVKRHLGVSPNEFRRANKT